MFNAEETRALRRIAAGLTRRNPSDSLLNRLADMAGRESIDMICLEIDVCANKGKLAGYGRWRENNQFAEQLKNLMVTLYERDEEKEEDDKGKKVRRKNQTKRAMALRYISRLRGRRYWELPKKERIQ